MAGINADIKGYRELSDGDIGLINSIKEVEKVVGTAWAEVFNSSNVDKRWASIAKTHFQEGFSALVRSVAQSEDVYK